MHRFLRLALVLAVALTACRSGQPRNTGLTPAQKQALMDPQSSSLNQQAPDEFQVLFTTSKGEFTVAVERALSPHGADRFYNLVANGFYDDQRFFRVVPGFVVQWGMHGDPEIMAQWRNATIPDDPVKGSNTPGTITYAKPPMPNSRSTQVFINLGDNSANLDHQGFPPFGRVIDGMDVVQSITSEYGERSNNQAQIGARGNAYLNERFPNLDYIVSARIVE